MAQNVRFVSGGINDRSGCREAGEPISGSRREKRGLGSTVLRKVRSTDNKQPVPAIDKPWTQRQAWVLKAHTIYPGVLEKDIGNLLFFVYHIIYSQAMFFVVLTSMFPFVDGGALNAT